jgi:hypothetical protein
LIQFFPFSHWHLVARLNPVQWVLQLQMCVKNRVRENIPRREKPRLEIFLKNLTERVWRIAVSP